jgi:lipopolysaccharide transport system ATP-binding protein
MSNIAILVENLSKRYKIGVKKEKYRTLRESLTRAAALPFHFFRRWQESGNSRPDTFWALKDVSLEIKAGAVVGIIGRNGAGKTTLLKILSRITEPTSGRAEIRGRVGSLLEVGTGFHPELTGRENIYLNAAILGMRKAEIHQKFDEIAAFAEVDKFLDTPVKHYSSGMYVRLAFAVAAHLEPEILLVDEVLAVGDAAFQKKCLGKMGEVAKEGRTVLFVSHNMEAILALCPQTFVLNNGSLAFWGNSDEALAYYLNSSSNEGPASSPHLLYQSTQAASPDKVRLDAIEILDRVGNPKPIINTWDDMVLRVHYFSPQDFQNGSIILDIRDFKQQRLIVLDSGLKIPLRKGSHYVDCLIPCLSLAAGEFYLGAGLSISTSEWLWRETNLASFKVQGKDVFGLGRPPALARMIFAIPHEWRDTD